MNFQIYEVNEKINEILSNHMDEDGNVSDIAVELLEKLQMERTELIKNLALAKKRNDIFVAGLKEEVKRLQSRIKSAERSSYWLEQQVSNNVERGETFKEPEFEIKWTTSNKVNIDEFDRNPEKDFNLKTFKPFIKQTISYAFDKKAISDFIKSGKTLKGCSIVTTKNLKIS